MALDGFALDTYPGATASETRRSIVVPPAGRAEFVVQGPPGGRGVLRTLCYDTGPNGDPDPEMNLALLRAPTNERRVMRIPAPSSRARRCLATSTRRSCRPLR